MQKKNLTLPAKVLVTESVMVEGPEITKELKSSRNCNQCIFSYFAKNEFNFRCTWQTLGSHLQILTRQAPDSVPEASKYVQFSLLVSPHLMVTVRYILLTF